MRRDRAAIILLTLALTLSAALPGTAAPGTGSSGTARAGAAPAWTAPGGAAPGGAAALLPRVPPDEFLADLMDSVRLDNVTGTIQRLQDFTTRYVVTDSCWAAATWLAGELEGYGYADVAYDSFRCWSYQDTVDAANVIAVKPGTTRPDEYVVIGGHYDSISTENFNTPFAAAPGADDNGTGVAGVLEAARLLAALELERSVVFALWSGEELGLRGSRAWVADAIDAGMDIVIYLNMDVIGYTNEPDPTAIVYCDSTSLAVAGLLQQLIIDHTPYGCVSIVQPVGASDQNSFSERGIHILDTSSGDGWSPYHHTPYDVIENVDLELCRALAAANVATTAALALVAGEEPNLAPETVLAETCPAQSDTLGPTPRFAWTGVDFDGTVAAYEYRVTTPDGARGDAHAGREWHPLPSDSTAVTLGPLDNGPHAFAVRAIDDDGLADATPASHSFTVDASLAPVLTVTPRFGPAADTLRVFENERLEFELVATASHYCATVDGISWGLDEDWSDWTTPGDAGTLLVVVRPAPGDTSVAFRVRDDDGSVTSRRLALDVVEAPMDRPLLLVDDWFGQAIPEAAHDAIYDSMLAGHTHDVWDPYEHIQGGTPQLPDMEELGRYDTVIWSLGDGATLLKPAQAESAYHAVEGFVRAGGNLVIEGFGTLDALAALDDYTPARPFVAGEFVHDYAGVDSVLNAGSLSDPQSPGTYGYAFLGGLSLDPILYPHLPVDTLGLWSDGYAQYGGLPSCEIYRTGRARRLHLFDAYLNDGLDEKPCATLNLSEVGCGSVATLGFPLAYIQRTQATQFLTTLLEGLEDWQSPSELVSFAWDESRDHVFFTWYLTPPGEPLGSRLERRHAGDGTFEPLGTNLLQPDEDGRTRFIDAQVEPGATYEYRLAVTERWGGVTRHGPWTIEIPTDLSRNRLERPHPNPSPGGATVAFTVADEHRWIRVAVYSPSGRLVRRLHDGPAGRGRHETAWDGRDERGNMAASGVYFVRADFGGEALERKLVLLR